MNFIPYGKQSIDTNDINEVCEVLKSDFLTTGPKVKEFEEKKFQSFVVQNIVLLCQMEQLLYI